MDRRSSVKGLRLSCPHLRIEAAVTFDRAIPSAGILDQAAGRSPYKYCDVESFIRFGCGPSAIQVRDALHEIPLVLTDAMAVVRPLDLKFGEDGLFPAYTIAAFSKGPATATFAAVRASIVDLIKRDLLYRSGAGTISSLTYSVGGLSIVRRGNPYSVSRLADGLTKLGEVVKVASKATILAHPERLDEALDSSLNSEPLRSIYSFGDDSHYAATCLRAIASSATIFDNGERQTTQVVAGMQQAAKVALDSSVLRPMEPRPDSEGYVVEGDDRDDPVLRVADATAGYARDVFAAHGLRGLRERFRSLVYNGEVLTPDRAAYLDRQRKSHDSLLARALR